MCRRVYSSTVVNGLIHSGTNIAYESRTLSCRTSTVLLCGLSFFKQAYQYIKSHKNMLDFLKDEFKASSQQSITTSCTAKNLNNTLMHNVTKGILLNRLKTVKLESAHAVHYGLQKNKKTLFLLGRKN